MFSLYHFIDLKMAPVIRLREKPLAMVFPQTPFPRARKLAKKTSAASLRD